MTLIIIQQICPALLLFFGLLLVPGLSHERGCGIHCGIPTDPDAGPVPEFDLPLPNLTLKQGADAAFTCIIKHLGKYKVAWIRSDDKEILAWHTTRVTHNHRYNVSHNGFNTWTLHIKNVVRNDSGSYMCQVNTDPQRSQYGHLNVVVPAYIVDEETSNDVMVLEGQPTRLKCKATGYPSPKVKWKREDGHALAVSKELVSPNQNIDVWEGETLPLRPLSRQDTGAYLCIAFNQVPPSMSKRVFVYVHFEPLITVSNQLVAAPIGANATLDCQVEAVPRPVISWFGINGQLLLESAEKYLMTQVTTHTYKLSMQLTILNLRAEDFGLYNCSAGNPLGATYGSLQLFLFPSTPRTTPSTTTHLEVWNKPNGKHKHPSPEHESNKHSKPHRKTQKSGRKGHHHSNHEDPEVDDPYNSAGALVTTVSSSSVTQNNVHYNSRDQGSNNSEDEDPKRQKHLGSGDIPNTLASPRWNNGWPTRNGNENCHSASLRIVVFLLAILSLFL